MRSMSLCSTSSEDHNRTNHRRRYEDAESAKGQGSSPLHLTKGPARNTDRKQVLVLMHLELERTNLVI